jgi:hypothetical protein
VTTGLSLGSFDAAALSLVDPVFVPETPVRYTYWPVMYQFGDPTIITQAPLPLSGVQFSRVMRGVGEFQATLQLADADVRAMYPWDKIVPRKTGIIAIRQTWDRYLRIWSSRIVWHGIVWAAPRDPQTGRMSISAQTIESLWARRVISGPLAGGDLTWTQVDQAQMAADLLTPAQFSYVPLGADPWPGWVNVDPPSVPTGVLRDFTYKRDQQTNLLEAHQKRSQVANGYEWTTVERVLSGDSDPLNASSYRCQFVLGYPRLGRSLSGGDSVPKLKYDRFGSGNVVSYQYAYDGSEVPNVVWGRGAGFDDTAVQAQIRNTAEWVAGFLQTESKFSDPDVSVGSTLEQYAAAFLGQKLASEQFVSALTLRGDVAPEFGSYAIGDDVLFETNDWTWPGVDDGEFVTLAARVFGWRVTPPQGNGAEKVEMFISGGDVQ